MKISSVIPGDGGDVIAQAVVEPTEATILVSLADQMQALLAESLESPVTDDTAVRRLLPDAYRSEPELADEWRRLSRRGLVDRKIGFARTISSALASEGEGDAARTVRLTSDDALDWVRGLGDLRLVIADRMGIVVDGDEGTFAEPGLREVYELLGWMQDALVTVIDEAEQSYPSEPL